VSPGLIVEVAPGSLAERAGLQPGHELLAINGQQVHDIIDVQFYGAEEQLLLTVRRKDGVHAFEARRQYGEPLGLDFAEPTFDGVRRCTNRCEFCFVAHMPLGLRRSLYVRDDDYRHSFLFGSYITLTNLTEADWVRIGRQQLSPLYVSVHATEPAVRRRMLANPSAPDVLVQLERLLDLGIEVHSQIVVVPGVNDGSLLTRSIEDVARLYPGVCSLSVVPVGVTRYQLGNCRVHTQAEIREVVDLVTEQQSRLRAGLGVGFAYLSDEWYLRLGLPVPSAEAYDGLDLTENGVGLVRRFLDRGFQLPGLPQAPSLQALTFVTGTLFAPVLREALKDRQRTEIVAVANRFFGETITVAGLLTGRDVVVALRDRSLGDVVVLPAAIFGGPEGQTLDGMHPDDVAQALGRPVVLAHLNGDEPTES
jgi:putative radical SAM enzyme (TIGR03279 family)